jgi:hypothetical protein
LNCFLAQLEALRAEIERMQAERQAFDNRAVFSSSRAFCFLCGRKCHHLQLPLGRNCEAQLPTSLSGILIFGMNYGPPLLLWAVILFLPALPLAPLTVALCSWELIELRALGFTQ